MITIAVAEADDEVFGAAEELEPIRCVGGWHRAGVRMGRLGRALCKRNSLPWGTAGDRPPKIRRRNGGVRINAPCR